MHPRIFCLCSLLFALTVRAEEPPTLPVGLDAYRLWEQWPYQRIGERAYMRSTYDRRGGNEGADASHFLYQRADDYNVTLDVTGPGVLYFARYNHWHGSPWHYVVDGADHIVRETSTANPNQPAENSVFQPETAFPNPLTWTWSLTKGADLMWVPIPYEKSFQMAYSRTHYGTGYYIYKQYVRGARLSQPIRSWTEQTPAPEVLNLISKSGTDLVPQPNTAEGRKSGIVRESGTWSMSGNSTVGVERSTREPQMLRALELAVPKDKAVEFGRCKIRITWDDLSHASVEAPIALFFGTGTFYNRDDREYLVKSFPMTVRFDRERLQLACYFPMPFFKTALIQLVGDGKSSISDIQWSARFAPYKGPANHVGYFHATYQDHPQPEPGRDLVLLDTRKTEGGGDWSGSFVGTSFIFTHQNNLGTLEGDPRFFFDDSLTPQAQGTGTEEWGGGGDYWGGRNMTLPFAGHPVGARKIEEAKCDEDKIHSAYRFLLADLMPFGKNAIIRLEHGAEDLSTEHYETVTYWYGLNRPSLVKTDTLQLGNEASEQDHRYRSPDASQPYEIISRYEWGVDTIKGKEVYSAETDRGRKTTGNSEFTLRIDPKNYGVMLRRKLDYAFPNQRAEVYIASAPSVPRTPRSPQPTGEEWKLAGTWYLAGGNTCIYSNPREELGITQHNVQTSNRRFRDDEFLIPRDLTQGRSTIRVRVKFTPVTIPLHPGQPIPELAWSEIRYDAYCFVMPKTSR